MGDRTGIEWTRGDDGTPGATWNPLVGCSRVSPGCDNCYAERQTGTRLKNVPAYKGLTERGKWTGEVRFLPERLEQPLRWRRPRRIFVNSMSDLFHEDVTPATLAYIFGVMAAAPQHTFQVLTKRPQRMARALEQITDPGWNPDADGIPRLDLAIRTMSDRGLPIDPGTSYGWPLPNVWLGTSIESQRYAFRARHLLDTPAAVRFVSAEPLLGPLDLSGYLQGWYEGAKNMLPRVGRIDWVIVGGESGPRARPMQPEWARALRDQCQEAGVAFLMKQWGEWGVQGWAVGHQGPLVKMGKHNAGRELDGRTWDEYPDRKVD